MLSKGIDSKIKKCKSAIAILLYKHSTDGHFVAIQYKNKKFNKCNSDETLPSVDTWLSKNSYTSSSLIAI